MGTWAWILLGSSAALLATGAKAVLHRFERQATTYGWASLASGAFLGGFAGSVGWDGGPMVDGLALLPALVGEIVVGSLLEIVYRLFLQPRQTPEDLFFSESVRQRTDLARRQPHQRPT